MDRWVTRRVTSPRYDMVAEAVDPLLLCSHLFILASTKRFVGGRWILVGAPLCTLATALCCSLWRTSLSVVYRAVSLGRLAYVVLVVLLILFVARIVTLGSCLPYMFYGATMWWWRRRPGWWSLKLLSNKNVSSMPCIQLSWTLLFFNLAVAATLVKCGFTLWLRSRTVLHRAETDCGLPEGQDPINRARASFLL
jgi:hypothetical protein